MRPVRAARDAGRRSRPRSPTATTSRVTSTTTLVNASGTMTVDASANSVGDEHSRRRSRGRFRHRGLHALVPQRRGHERRRPASRATTRSSTWTTTARRPGASPASSEAIDLVSGSTVHVAAGLLRRARRRSTRPDVAARRQRRVSKQGTLRRRRLRLRRRHQTASSGRARPSNGQSCTSRPNEVVFDGFVVANEVCADRQTIVPGPGRPSTRTAPRRTGVQDPQLRPRARHQRRPSQRRDQERSGVTVYGAARAIRSS